MLSCIETRPDTSHVQILDVIFQLVCAIRKRYIEAFVDTRCAILVVMGHIRITSLSESLTDDIFCAQYLHVHDTFIYTFTVCGMGKVIWGQLETSNVRCVVK